MKKKILLFGETDVFYSTTIEIKDALTNLGYNVIDINYRSIANTHSIFPIKSFMYKLVNYLSKKLLQININFFYYNVLGRNKLNTILLEYLNDKYFFVIFTKCDFINPRILKYYSKKFLTFYFFFDPYQEILNFNLFNHFKYVDRGYVISPQLSKKLSKYIHLNVHYCPQGIDLEKWRDLDLTKSIDVVFVGAANKKRKKFIKYLLNNHIDVIAYGDGWDNKPIYNEDLVNIYNKSKIALNFTRERDNFSVRLYQVMSTGCFMLSEYSTAIDNNFQKELHLETFINRKECLEKIKRYLSDTYSRDFIRKTGMKFVRKNYNWENILKKYFIHYAQK